MSGYLTIEAKCECCAGQVPASITRAQFVKALRARADDVRPGDAHWYSTNTARRHVNDLRRLADQVEAGGRVPACDFQIGQSLVWWGLHGALKGKGWTKGVPCKLTVRVAKGGRATGCSYDWWDGHREHQEEAA